MGVEAQATGLLRLNEQGSDDNAVRPLHMGQRLMAQAVDGSIWYGFVLVSSEQEFIRPGECSCVEIAFLDDEGAKKAFPIDTVIHFGDGIRTRGTIELRWKDPVGDGPVSLPQ
jgi:hypothetical protein